MWQESQPARKKTIRPAEGSPGAESARAVSASMGRGAVRTQSEAAKAAATIVIPTASAVRAVVTGVAAAQSSLTRYFSWHPPQFL
jgi:hypothetical protein